MELRTDAEPTFRELQQLCGDISSSVLAARLRELGGRGSGHARRLRLRPDRPRKDAPDAPAVPRCMGLKLASEGVERDKALDATIEVRPRWSDAQPPHCRFRPPSIEVRPAVPPRAPPSEENHGRSPTQRSRAVPEHAARHLQTGRGARVLTVNEFVASYAAAFATYDAATLAHHFVYPVHVVGDTGGDERHHRHAG